MSNGVIEIAKQFASHGYLVFPTYQSKESVRAKPFGWTGKPPTDPQKLKLAIYPTTSSNDIDMWEDKIRMYHSLITGFGIIGRNCIIFDIDEKNGKHGLESFKQLRTRFDIPKPSIVTQTKSGGFHFFYGRPRVYTDAHIKTVSNLTIDGTEYPGVDVRGNGGCVIGPDIITSEYQEGKYCLIYGSPASPLTDLPENLCKHLSISQIKPEKDNLADSLVVSGVISTLSPEEQAKHGIMPDTVPVGQRNSVMFLYISALKNKMYSKKDIRSLCEILLTRCEESDSTGIDLDDMIERSFTTDHNNPYDIARYILENDFYKLVSRNVLYFTTKTTQYFLAGDMMTSSSLRELLRPYSAKVQVGDEKPKNLNPAEVILNKISSENLVSGTASIGRDEKIIHFKNKKFVNIYNKPDTTGVADVKVIDEFQALIERLFLQKGSYDFELAMDFLSWGIQNPQLKTSMAIFLISKNRGVGKSLLFNLLSGIHGQSKFGHAQAEFFKIEQLSSKFFDPSNCIMCLLDEVQFSYHRNLQQETAVFWRHIKNLITSPEISVEEKFKDVLIKPNLASYMLAGNSANNFPMEELDRRIWVVDSEAAEIPVGTCDSLYNAIKIKYNQPAESEHVFKSIRIFLNERKIINDLTSIRAPHTVIKDEMVRNSMAVEEEWFKDYFGNPENLFARRPFITMNMLKYILLYNEYIPASWSENYLSVIKLLRRTNTVQALRRSGSIYQLKNITDIDQNGKIITNTQASIYFTRELTEIDVGNIKPYIQDHIEDIKSFRKAAFHL